MKRSTTTTSSERLRRNPHGARTSGGGGEDHEHNREGRGWLPLRYHPIHDHAPDPVLRSLPLSHVPPKPRRRIRYLACSAPIATLHRQRARSPHPLPVVLARQPIVLRSLR